MNGVLRGAAVGLAVLAGLLQTSRTRETWAAVPEAGGAVRLACVHFRRDAADLLGPTYRDLFRRLDAEVLVVCPEEADWDAFRTLRAAAGIERARFRPVFTRRQTGCWAKDRFVAVRGVHGLRLLVPEAPPATPGGRDDWLVAWDVAQTLGGGVRTLPFELDGGDIWPVAGLAFVHRRVIERNGHLSEAEIRRTLEEALGARLIVVDGPPHHLGMFMSPLDERTVILADADLGRLLVDRSFALACADPILPDQARESRFDFARPWLSKLRELRAFLERQGFRIVRIPFAPTREDRSYATYNNVVLDGRRVFLPFYGVPALDEAAARVWESEGYSVCRVDCRALLPFRGAVHCLVNVLARG